ncbi:hypothetical protein SKAU_G00429680 [Synaphobranchus kaupii]|uniref:Uncharacterized protein n=1 Tax=Synaphobranchus kaupii TaxID=118154 RepID=A0A9Q1E4T3_SYNKA|nr:hypothetical protein SKAU_G00429680 [Synaphobranchus kaupii]
MLSVLLAQFTVQVKRREWSALIGPTVPLSLAPPHLLSSYFLSPPLRRSLALPNRLLLSVSAAITARGCEVTAVAARVTGAVTAITIELLGSS